MSAANNGRAILAIDAGTTGVTALVVTPDGRIDARGYQEFGQHFPKPGWVEHAPEEIWQATLEATRDCLAAWDGEPGDLSGIGITNQRETVLLWDRETLGSPRRAIVWQDRRTADDLQPAARRGPRGAGHRADRPAPGPVLLRHQADVAGRERAEHLGAGRPGSLRRRHRRLLPDRPDDARDLAHHRRLQRVPHAALRPRGGRLVRGAVRAVRRADGRAAGGGAQLGRARPHRPEELPRPRPPDRRHRRRPAVGAVRSDLLRRGRLQVHLRHRLVHPDQHRDRGGPLRRRPAVHRGLALTGRRDDLRPRGGDLRDGRGGAVAARRPADRRLRRRDRSDRLHRRQHRRRGVRARPDRPGRAALGPARARHDPRHHARYDASPPGARDPRGDRLRGPRRHRHDADEAAPR